MRANQSRPRNTGQPQPTAEDLQWQAEDNLKKIGQVYGTNSPQYHSMAQAMDALDRLKAFIARKRGVRRE